jgi:hypothetical protein
MISRALGLLVLPFVLLSLPESARSDEWVHGQFGTNNLVWGAKGGLLFAISPSGFRPPEPRGLIRLGYPILTNGQYDLVNFIAIEPFVNGRKGYSELEKSKLDQVAGKRLWLISESATSEKLTVRIGVERFDNGAEIQLRIEQRAAAADEIAITTEATTNSAKMEFCILTATMGNMARTRELWLKDRTVRASQLYADYSGSGFAPHTSFAADQLLRLDDGSLIAAITTDETEPAAAMPFSKSNFWHYRGAKVTQYWKHPASATHDGLTVVVNARHTYYGSRREIPRGNAFENFEMRQPFKEGQQFIFGITRRTPVELGLHR